ncbi:PREDICTED: uncharacterized protein LOC108759103 [Trachymyrmex cornetzi]|uniref:uncharacterized protein LOC108759103 n=1 Tax=Trachymyrmex cornetzi TaxID=471704 RepID=UPI00084F737E|nr:PREDICTED: uncharacterized protein LOC108759103 [Trachymyrmex cornetzi]
MIRKTNKRSWNNPQNIEKFQNYISTALENKLIGGDSIDTLNNTIMETIQKARKKYCPGKKREQKISHNTRKLIEERRLLISNKEAKENRSLKVLKRNLAKGKTEIVKLQNRNNGIEHNRNKLIEIVEKFYEELCRSHRNENSTLLLITAEKGVLNQESEDIPEITTGKIQNALRKMKNNRSPSDDEIVIEAIKIGGEIIMKKIETLFNLCLQDATIYYRWNNAVMILLHKKSDKTNLENYRPISLLDHLYKLFTRIITTRMENKLDLYQPREQAEFCSNFRTNDHLQSLKVLIEKSVEYNRPLVSLFVDFQKAFDTIEHNNILIALKECQINYRYTKIIHKIFINKQQQQ